jgi:hypothetical protein
MSDARRAFSANPLAAFVATGFGSGLAPVAPGRSDLSSASPSPGCFTLTEAFSARGSDC